MQFIERKSDTTAIPLPRGWEWGQNITGAKTGVWPNGTRMLGLADRAESNVTGVVISLQAWRKFPPRVIPIMAVVIEPGLARVVNGGNFSKELNGRCVRFEEQNVFDSNAIRRSVEQGLTEDQLRQQRYFDRLEANRERVRKFEEARAGRVQR
jgi:hypothetical protein